MRQRNVPNRSYTMYPDFQDPVSLLPAFLCAAAILLLAGCASSGNAYYTPAPGFDAGAYVSPADFEHPLRLGEQPADSAEPHPDFRPVAFEGGLAAMQERLQYPENHVSSERTGEVLLQVYVDTTGAIANIREVSSPAYFLTEAAVEVVREAVSHPARWRGVAVNAFTVVPLQFTLNEVEVRRNTGNGSSSLTPPTPFTRKPWL
ncbi:MAG: energy transducer TonB [Balneolaceae bacterium]|nr:energy transducer TonB [Balneolaceae bacterium]